MPGTLAQNLLAKVNLHLPSGTILLRRQQFSSSYLANHSQRHEGSQQSCLNVTLTGAATDGISGNTFCQCFAQCFRPTRGRKDIDMAILESTCWSCQLDKATSFIHGRKVYAFTLLTYSFFTEGAVYSWASTCFNIIHSLSDCAMRGLQKSRTVPLPACHAETSGCTS